jgi:hypothetical protein
MQRLIGSMPGLPASYKCVAPMTPESVEIALRANFASHDGSSAAAITKKKRLAGANLYRCGFRHFSSHGSHARCKRAENPRTE